MQTAVKGILRIKTDDYRFWMKFAQFTVLICKKLFVGSPERNVLSTCFPFLDRNNSNIILKCIFTDRVVKCKIIFSEPAIKMGVDS